MGAQIHSRDGWTENRGKRKKMRESGAEREIKPPDLTGNLNANVSDAYSSSESRNSPQYIDDLRTLIERVYARRNTDPTVIVAPAGVPHFNVRSIHDITSLMQIH